METFFLLTLFVARALTLPYPTPPGNNPPVRMVDGTDLKSQPAPRVRGVPAPQARTAPAPQARTAPARAPVQVQRYYYPYPVIVNVYQTQPAPANEPNYEDAYYNPVAPVYYVSWPQYFWRGNFYPWGVYRPYPFPPHSVSHYRYIYGGAIHYYSSANSNIHYNSNAPAHLP